MYSRAYVRSEPFRTNPTFEFSSLQSLSDRSHSILRNWAVVENELE